jgi:hypothetical protein
MRVRAAARWAVPAVVALLLASTAPAGAAMRIASPAPWLPTSDPTAVVLADDALQRIIEAVQKRYNARVVKVTEITVDGKRAYEFRLLSDQRVWTVRVNAETGQELSRND